MIMFFDSNAVGNRQRSFLQLGLLYTEEIRINFVKKIKKAFLHTGAKAVYIPGNKFHNGYSLSLDNRINRSYRLLEFVL